MKTAILGLGIIGSTWAKNLIDDGLEVRTWNRTPRDFPGAAASVQEAAEGAEFIIIVVADPPAVAGVLDQLCPVLKAGQVVIQSSTISAEWSRKFAAQVQQAGAEFLEAPFTGSKPAAEQRKTVFYVGGDDAVLERSRPLLERLSSAIQHIGPIGSASSLKLALNANIACMAQALCESLTLCRAEGITDETYFEALKLNAARSGLSDLKEPKLRARDYSPQFSVKHMAKDLRLARETAGAAGVELPALDRVLELYQRAAVAGWSDEDYIGLVRLLERE
jgi:3-hydroxyisobutyrate dehydrogenase-like beta-hydroxyacid dehydrogenase